MNDILMLLGNPVNTDTRVLYEIDALIKNGFEVDIVCRDKNLKNKGTMEISDGFLTFYQRDSKLMRKLAWFSEILILPMFNYRLYKRAKELIDVFGYKTVHAHDFDTLITAILLKLTRNVKVVYDAHEIFSKMVSADLPSFVCKAIQTIENIALKFIDSMIVISKPYYEFYKTKTNAPIVKVTHYKPLKWKNYYPTKNKKFSLLYIGNNLSSARYFPEIIDITSGLGIELRIGGVMNDKHRKIIQYTKEKGYKHVKFLGELPDGDSILNETRKADATFILVDPNKNPQYKYNLFNKQFEAMAAGRPIITTFGTNAAKIIKKEVCGMLTYRYPPNIKFQIRYLANNPSMCKKLGTNALQAAKREYNWEKESKQLVLLHEATSTF